MVIVGSHRKLLLSE